MPTKNAAVFFVDMVDFTRLTSGMSREQIVNLLDTYEKLALPVFQKFGGQVIKEIGDAYLVVFDSPTDAVLAGKKLQENFREHNKTAGTPLHVRIGIGSGEVILEKNEENHPLFSMTGELFASLDGELKEIPNDLVQPFKGIKQDLQALREKTSKLNNVWKSSRRLLAQMSPESVNAGFQGLPAAAQEQENKTRKNLGDLETHIDAEMGETLTMLRALLVQVMQLKAATRATASDSFSQIRENLRQRLVQLETVQETFRPFDSWREKA